MHKNYLREYLIDLKTNKLVKARNNIVKNKKDYEKFCKHYNSKQHGGVDISKINKINSLILLYKDMYSEDHDAKLKHVTSMIDDILGELNKFDEKKKC